jgi:hypothetical protein
VAAIGFAPLHFGCSLRFLVGDTLPLSFHGIRGILASPLRSGFGIPSLLLRYRFVEFGLTFSLLYSFSGLPFPLLKIALCLLLGFYADSLITLSLQAFRFSDSPLLSLIAFPIQPHTLGIRTVDTLKRLN